MQKSSQKITFPEIAQNNPKNSHTGNFHMHFFSYNEKKQHGSPEFPVAYYYVDEEHPRYNMPFHFHKEWEIIHILRGNFLISIDGKEYTAKENDILLLQEGMLHGGTPQNCIYQCFNFDLHVLFSGIPSVRNFIRPFYQNTLLPMIYYPDRQPDIYPIVNELLSVFRNDMPEDFQRLMTLGNISRLFAVLLEKHFYTENNEDVSDIFIKIARLKPVFEYIETHFSTPLSLTELAKIIGMNPRYFCRFFSSITHQTPMDYVNYYRIEQAANMLCNTEMTVTDVGLECGYNDTCHFIKTFKKYKNITPKQYQKQNSIFLS